MANDTVAAITLAVEINALTNEEKAINSATVIKTKTGIVCATRAGGQHTGAEALIVLADSGEGLGAGVAVGAVVVVVEAVGDAGESRPATRHVASGSVPTPFVGDQTSITGMSVAFATVSNLISPVIGSQARKETSVLLNQRLRQVIVATVSALDSTSGKRQMRCATPGSK